MKLEVLTPKEFLSVFANMENRVELVCLRWKKCIVQNGNKDDGVN